jgi:hypothetical protein
MRATTRITGNATGIARGGTAGVPDLRPVTRVRAGKRRLTFALGVAAGLLALSAPAAVASTQPTALLDAAATPPAKTASAQLVIGQLNPYTTRSYKLAAPYGGCVFSVGDRYEGPGGAAVGMAAISCPSPHTYRVLVYLDFHDYANGKEYTYRHNVKGTPYYNYNAGVWSGCATSVWAYWTTYAKISIDGNPYSGFFKSDSNQYYSAGPNCP